VSSSQPLPGSARKPRHLAVIMDGNGRWAERRHRPRVIGHRAGVRAVQACLEFCLAEGIECLTLFAFSSENWNRPAEEVGALMKLFLRMLDNEVDELQMALGRIDARGGTAMRDAIAMSMQHLKKAHRDKKVLVVITDGNDNSSIVSLEKIMKEAHQRDVLIYGVGILAEEERREAGRARKALNDLAEATGGKTFFPQSVEEVDAIAHQVARDIRNQYIIEYSPLNAAMDGTFRAIRIAVKASGGPTVRTRSGYYATPDAKTNK